MKQTILIHGAPYEEEFYNPETPSPSNANWFPWLQKQMALKNELCQALEFPRPYDPIYSDWVSVFKSCNPTEREIPLSDIAVAEGFCCVIFQSIQT